MFYELLIREGGGGEADGKHIDLLLNGNVALGKGASHGAGRLVVIAVVIGGGMSIMWWEDDGKQPCVVSCSIVICWQLERLRIDVSCCPTKKA